MLFASSWGPLGGLGAITNASGDAQNLASPWDRGGSLVLQQGFPVAWRSRAQGELLTHPCLQPSTDVENRHPSKKGQRGEHRPTAQETEALLPAPPLPPDGPAQSSWLHAPVCPLCKAHISGELSDRQAGEALQEPSHGSALRRGREGERASPGRERGVPAL